MQAHSFSREGRLYVQLDILFVGKQRLGAAQPLLQKSPGKHRVTEGLLSVFNIFCLQGI